MFKKFMGTVLLVVLVPMLLCTAVCAEGLSFSLLNNTETENNRLFEVLLSGKEVYGLAAFVAELEYDENSVEFRKAESKIDSSFISINDEALGKVRVAFLCEEGLGEESEIMSFTFMAKGDCDVKLKVEQTIDKYGNDMSVSECKGLVLKTVDDAYENKTASDSDKRVSSIKTEESRFSETEASKDLDENIAGLQHNYEKFIGKDYRGAGAAFAIGAALVGSGMVAVAFMMGRRSFKKDNDKREVTNEEDS